MIIIINTAIDVLLLITNLIFVKRSVTLWTFKCFRNNVYKMYLPINVENIGSAIFSK